MGHDNMQAAVIYQHATRRADRAIAAALDAQLREAQGAREGSANRLAPTEDGTPATRSRRGRSLMDRSPDGSAAVTITGKGSTNG